MKLLNVVEHLQDFSFVHTDIAPQNILIKNDNTDLILIDIDDIDLNGKTTRNIDVTIGTGVYNSCNSFTGGIKWYMSYDTAAVCYIIITFLLWNVDSNYNLGSNIQEILSPDDPTKFENYTIKELNDYYTSPNTLLSLQRNPFSNIMFMTNRPTFISQIYKGITFVPPNPNSIENNPKYNLCDDIIKLVK